MIIIPHIPHIIHLDAIDHILCDIAFLAFQMGNRAYVVDIYGHEVVII